MREQTFAGFPKRFIPFVRCLHDGADLALQAGYRASSHDHHSVQSGALKCVACGATFMIDDGILNLLDAQVLDAQSAEEQRCRDAESATVDPITNARERAHNDMEMLPTLHALPVNRHQTLLELGCGEGRYTVALAERTHVLAVDFSMQLLRKLQRSLPPDMDGLGLVACDVTRMKVAPQRFDMVFSTLTSNLPSRRHRESLYMLARTALHPRGRFVFSSHHHGLRQRLAREAKSGHYKLGGIYRYNFDVNESIDEVSPHFASVDARPIRVVLPFARTLGLPVVRLSMWLERVPLLNKFGMLVLGVAQEPRPLVTQAETPKSSAQEGAVKWRHRVFQLALSGQVLMAEWGSEACALCLA